MFLFVLCLYTDFGLVPDKFIIKHIRHFFYHATLCWRGICYGTTVDLRLTVGLSVTSPCSIKTAKHIITQYKLDCDHRIY